MVFIVQASFLSALAVLGLLSYIAYSTIKLKNGASRHWSTTTHVHWYFVSMMVSDLIQAIGGILNIRWIEDSGVTEGAYCSAQGALKQAGDVGVALASLAIAIHTFAVLVFRWRPKNTPTIAIIVVSTIWLFVILLISISFGTHKGKDYYGNTQYWCWITSAYPAQRIALEYFWMWFTSLLNIVLYVPIALVLKGIITVRGFHVRLLSQAERRRTSVEAVSGREISSHIALKMIMYPALYTVTVLPIAIVRWESFLGGCVPWAATVFADVVFASSGLFNVLLYSFTRPNLLPQRDRATSNSDHGHGGSFKLSPPVSPRSPTGGRAPPLSAIHIQMATDTTVTSDLDRDRDRDSDLRYSASMHKVEDGVWSMPVPPDSAKVHQLHVSTSHLGS